VAEAILDALGPVLTRWTIGGSAISAAPTGWRDALGVDAGEAELRLLALSGHLVGTLALAEPPGAVRTRDDIPVLAQPPLPETLRPRARRLLHGLRETGPRRALLDFLDARGWTLHPGDWMPGKGDDVPDVYAAWQDWAAASGFPSSSPETLSAESWDDFGPAARHAAFTALRLRDPAGASELLAGKIAGETPDRRVRLLEVVATKLTNVDRPLLESLAGDRAPRVKALAASLMARLGHGETGGEGAAELADFFPVQTKGLFRRTRAIVPREVKSAAQRNRRTALLEALSLDAFAQALGLSPEDLVTAWPWGSDVTADRPFATMAARSAPDAIVAAAAEALTTSASADFPALVGLLPRLAPRQRRRAAIALLRGRQAGFATALTIAGGGGGIDDAIRMPAGTALLEALGAEHARPADQASELLSLGLLASRTAAKQALDQLAAAGLIASDPRLDMLRLNAALEHRRPTE